MAIAMLASVTVSMAADTMGRLRPVPFLVSRVDTSTSFGCISDRHGTRRTSSKVRPTGISWFISYPSAAAAAPWHFLYFLPEPHGHGSLRPTFG